MTAPRFHLPQDGQIFLDHVGHFVADIEAAAEALRLAGFSTTPVAIHLHGDDGGPPRPSGTGNCCVMLEQGYVEVLFQTADTPLGRQVADRLDSHAGVHLAAFAVADSARAHARLTAAGFATQPLVSLRRPVPTERDGDAEARFTVARVEPHAMPEGRIQILTHHTGGAVWQPRWLDHANGAVGLGDLYLVTDHPPAAARRWADFLGRPASLCGVPVHVATERGRVIFADPGEWRTLFPGAPLPAVPSFPVYGIRVRDLAAADRRLAAAGLTVHPVQGRAALLAEFPAALGLGAWLFEQIPGPSGNSA